MGRRDGRLASGHTRSASPGATLEQALDGGGRLNYQAFLDAIADATLAALPSRAFPSSDEPVRWEHILPWLSRDQECRFADFLEWRHSSSGADAPSLTSTRGSLFFGQSSA